MSIIISLVSLMVAVILLYISLIEKKKTDTKIRTMGMLMNDSRELLHKSEQIMREVEANTKEYLEHVQETKIAMEVVIEMLDQKGEVLDGDYTL